MSTTDVATVDHEDHRLRLAMNRALTVARVLARSPHALREDLRANPGDAEAIAITLVTMSVPVTPNNINQGYVIKGKVEFMTALWLGLGVAYGHRIVVDDEASDATVGVAHLTRGDTGEKHTARFTWEDAVKAKLVGSDTYQKYGADMLKWRALSRVIKWGAPEIKLGLGGGFVDMPADMRPPVARDPDTGQPVGEDPEIVDAEIIEASAQASDGGQAAPAPEPSAAQKGDPPPSGGAPDERAHPLAQSLHIAASKAGLTDKALDDIIRYVTGDEAGSANSITPDQAPQVFALIADAAKEEAGE